MKTEALMARSSRRLEESNEEKDCDPPVWAIEESKWTVWRIWNRGLFEAIEEHTGSNCRMLSELGLAKLFLTKLGVWDTDKRFHNPDHPNFQKVYICRVLKKGSFDKKEQLILVKVHEMRCAETFNMEKTARWVFEFHTDLGQVISDLVARNDILVVWGGIQNEQSRSIVLNDFNKPTYVAVYRHDVNGLRGPSRTEEGEILNTNEHANLQNAYYEGSRGEEVVLLEQILPPQPRQRWRVHRYTNPPREKSSSATSSPSTNSPSTKQRLATESVVNLSSTLTSSGSKQSPKNIVEQSGGLQEGSENESIESSEEYDDEECEEYLEEEVEVVDIAESDEEDERGVNVSSAQQLIITETSSAADAPDDAPTIGSNPSPVNTPACPDTTVTNNSIQEVFIPSPSKEIIIEQRTEIIQDVQALMNEMVSDVVNTEEQAANTQEEQEAEVEESSENVVDILDDFTDFVFDDALSAPEEVVMTTNSEDELESQKEIPGTNVDQVNSNELNQEVQVHVDSAVLVETSNTNSEEKESASEPVLANPDIYIGILSQMFELHQEQADIVLPFLPASPPSKNMTLPQISITTPPKAPSPTESRSTSSTVSLQGSAQISQKKSPSVVLQKLPSAMLQKSSCSLMSLNSPFSVSKLMKEMDVDTNNSYKSNQDSQVSEVTSSSEEEDAETVCPDNDEISSTSSEPKETFLKQFFDLDPKANRTFHVNCQILQVIARKDRDELYLKVEDGTIPSFCTKKFLPFPEEASQSQTQSPQTQSSIPNSLYPLLGTSVDILVRHSKKLLQIVEKRVNKQVMLSNVSIESDKKRQIYFFTMDGNISTIVSSSKTPGNAVRITGKFDKNSKAAAPTMTLSLSASSERESTKDSKGNDMKEATQLKRRVRVIDAVESDSESSGASPSVLDKKQQELTAVLTHDQRNVSSPSTCEQNSTTASKSRKKRQRVDSSSSADDKDLPCNFSSDSAITASPKTSGKSMEISEKLNKNSIATNPTTTVSISHDGQSTKDSKRKQKSTESKKRFLIVDDSESDSDFSSESLFGPTKKHKDVTAEVTQHESDANRLSTDKNSSPKERQCLDSTTSADDIDIPGNISSEKLSLSTPETVRRRLIFPKEMYHRIKQQSMKEIESDLSMEIESNNSEDENENCIISDSSTNITSSRRLDCSKFKEVSIQIKRMQGIVIGKTICASSFLAEQRKDKFSSPELITGSKKNTATPEEWEEDEVEVIDIVTPRRRLRSNAVALLTPTSARSKKKIPTVVKKVSKRRRK